MANLALQVLSCRGSSGVATAATNLTRLPPLWQARQHLRFPRASEQSHRLGSLALLFQSRMSLERVQRLCGLSEYCPLGRSPDSSRANYWTDDASCHHAPVCSPRFVYRNAGGATVTAAGESSPPDRKRTNLLQWLALLRQASFVVCHSDHASFVWLRRAKAEDNTI